jgi:Asp-tRNA(Asn)/Glu-tRNA(Gln) amidotransferase B subunit
MSPERSAPYAVGWGSFVGHVMRETGGESDPKVVNKLLRDELSA